MKMKCKYRQHRLTGNTDEGGRMEMEARTRDKQHGATI